MSATTIDVRVTAGVVVDVLGVLPTGPRGPASTGGGAVRIEDEGTTVTAEATALNFVGAAVAATDAGAGEVTVTISEPAAATVANGLAAEITARADADTALDGRLDVVEPKVAHLTVTQDVDLDAIEARVNSLDAAVVLRGSWDASAGTFPGGGTAQAGDSYIVSVAGTVGGIPFAVGDRAIAVTDDASTTVFVSNWFKADYTDLVLSVAGRTGAVVITSSDLADFATAALVAGAGTYAPLVRTLAGLDLTANRSASDLKTALSLAKGDVGLGNVDNTSDANKPVSTAAQTALDLKVPTSRQLAGLDLSADRTAAALRTALSLVIGTNAQAWDADLDAIAALAPSNDDIVQRKAGAWTNRTMAQLIADLAALGTTFQPLDSDLTAIAALSTTSYGRALLVAADLPALRTILGPSGTPSSSTYLRGDGTWATAGVTWPLANVGAAAATDALTSQVTADTQQRFTLNTDGSIEWGSGAAVADVGLRRSAAGNLDVYGPAGGGTALRVAYSTSLDRWIAITGSDAFGDHAISSSFNNTIKITNLNVRGHAVGAVPLTSRGMASQTGNLVNLENSSSVVLFAIDANGFLKWVSGKEQTTVGAAGGASALPATPTKFLQVKDSAGTTLVVPAYAAA